MGFWLRIFFAPGEVQEFQVEIDLRLLSMTGEIKLIYEAQDFSSIGFSASNKYAEISFF